VEGFADGAAATAKFNAAWGVAVGGDGKVYVADTNNHRVRVIHGGKVDTLAGSGQKGYLDGPAKAAQFNGLMGVVVDKLNRVLTVESHNQRVRMISGGNVIFIAGAKDAGFLDGHAKVAKFNNPRGITQDTLGRTYIADRGNHRIRLVWGGLVGTLAGSGKQGSYNSVAILAYFNLPSGLAVDSKGVVYVADTDNHLIRVITNGQTSTLHGTSNPTDGGPPTFTLNYPMDVAFDKNGDLLIADTYNHRIVKYSL